jgi:RNA polymerase sigma factor (sigma-70 family)
MAERDACENLLLSETPQAWDALIESVGPASLLVVIESRMSTRLLRRITPEDIWQDSLMHAWRDRRQFVGHGPKSFRSWLLTIIDHRIQDAVVRESALKRGGPGAPGEIPLSTLAFKDDSQPPVPLSSTTPSRVAIYKEQAEAMRAALEGLPPDLRVVVQQRLFEQRTLEETAGNLGITLAAVRYRFARGLEAYREALRAHFASRSQSAMGPSTTNPPADSSA